RFFRVPNHMQNDILKRRIAVVAVSAPAAAAQVHLDVARTRRVLAHLHQGVAKIRSAFKICKTGMKHTDGSTVQSFQLLALEALMLPDALQQTFGWRLAVLV